MEWAKENTQSEDEEIDALAVLEMNKNKRRVREREPSMWRSSILPENSKMESSARGERIASRIKHKSFKWFTRN